MYNLPYGIEALFVGRRIELELIASELDSRRLAFVTGLAGIGKSVVARAYVERNEMRYSYILWLDATSPDSIRHSCETILHSIDPWSRAEDSANALIRRLARLKVPWLLVFDGAQYAQVPRVPRMPSPFTAARRGYGYILVTSRDSSVKGLRLGPLSEAETAELILRGAKQLGTEDRLETVPEAIQRFARDLGREVSGIPLAARQMAAYIEETGAAIEDCLNLLRLPQYRLLMLQRATTLYMDERTVVGDWAQDMATLDWMTRYALRWLVQRRAPTLAGLRRIMGSEDAMRQAVAGLSQVSFIVVDEGGRQVIRMYPLLREVLLALFGRTA